MGMYNTFAELYDELFDNNEYIKWMKYVNKHVKNKNMSILDLAGGTGKLAILLKKNKYTNVTLFDISEDMLTIANKRANENNIDLPILVGDMREWSDYQNKFDLITSFDDSLNYLNNSIELFEAFKQVFNHLSEEGIFLFDVITPYQTDIIYPGYMYNWNDNNRFFMWNSYGIEEAEHTVEHELSFFIKDQNNKYNKLQEIHVEKTYDKEEYINLLKKSGFNNIEITADYGNKNIDEKTARWFFKATKI